MRKLWAALIASFILNIVLIMCIRFETPFFNESGIWTSLSMENSGVLIFTDVKERRPKTFIQHWKIHCFERECSLVDSSLSDRTFINASAHKLEIRKLDYNEQVANLVFDDCQITIVGQTGTFLCKNGSAGTLGSHIRLYHEMYSPFKG